MILKSMHLSTLRKKHGGYGRYVDRLTDRRRNQTMVCVFCRGPLFTISRSLVGTSVHCERCGEVRAVQVVEARKAANDER